MHDLAIFGGTIVDGTIVDGTGAPAFPGDVASDGNRIAAIGGKAGPVPRLIDADGCPATLVAGTPTGRLVRSGR